MTNARRLRSGLCLAAVCLLGSARVARADWTHLGPLESHAVEGSTLALRCMPGTVRLEAVAEGVVRVRLAPDGEFPDDFSWAVTDLRARGRWEVDASPADRLKARTAGLTVEILRDPCRLRFLDEGGHVLLADEPARGLSWRAPQADETRPVQVWQQLPPRASIYGLGEKGGPMDRRGRAFVMWNTDAWGYGAETDPLYASIPFFMIREDGRFTGVFLDNPWRTNFDFGHLEPAVMSFGAEGGELNYYVIAGPGPRDVLARYTALTGRIELPPKWAIGYHQCRYSYYPEERVREVARTFREKRIPCDVLWFDIDYMDGYRVFTWDPERFPDPKQLNADLEALGFHTIAIIDPCVKQDPDYALYREGTALSAWVTTPEGEPYVGRVWPGECTFPDFTNSEVRTWWAAQYPRFLLESGLDGVWNDMNEPADFAGPNKTLPLDVCFANQGNPASHRAAHNVYGMLMAGAAHEGLRRAYPDRRPFTLTRATFAGGQRYGALWTGDNLSTFEHLRMSIAMVASLGMSGMPFVGPDIGGFASGATPALYARWLNAAALFPFARTHTGSNSPDQEPWSYGKEIEAIARKALERRYQWLPYIYTLFEECARTGVPIIRPVWMEISNSPDWLEDTTFFLGPHVYVAPILQAEEIPYGVYLPEGVWFDGNTGLVHGGQRFVNVPGSLDVLPHFFRAGAIVPMQSTIQHTSETPEHPLIIDVWPWGASQGELYEDDGISPAYRDGAFRRTRFTCVREAGTVVFTMHAAEGSYEPPPRSPVVRLHGLRVEGYAITGSVEMNPGWSEAGGLQDPASGAWLFRLGEDKGQEQKLTVTFASAEPPDPEPIEFETAASAIEQVHHLSTPQIVDGAAVLHVRRPDSPYILLPRLYFAAQEYPMLKIRMSTEHARTLSVRFATEEQPDRLGGEKSALSLTPDGEFHDYAFDLGEAVEGWGGTVFRLELHWRDGVRPNERIRIDRIEFAER